jgi:adenosylhomocysteinase
MSFANQALGLEYLAKKRGQLAAGVYPMPSEIDENVAALKLRSLGVAIDTLTPEQKKYLSTWQEGT